MPPWVIVSGGYHFTGGQPKPLAWLADFLARAGHPVHLVGHDFDQRLLDRPEVTAHRVLRPLRVDAAGNVLLARAGRSVARRVTAGNPAARVVTNGGICVWPDINWVHYLQAAFTPDLRVAPHWFRLKERVVGGWYRRRERQALQAARLILTNSKRTTADVVARIDVPADRVRTVYYGADPNWSPPSGPERVAGRAAFGLSADRPVVVFVGAFSYDNRKGFDTLLAAWRQVAQEPGWDAELVLAGGGRAAAAVAALVARDGPPGVRVIGFTNRVFDLLAAADLLVSPVRYEPYGLNVQEAVCRGIPAIVSAIAGVAEEYPPELADAVLKDPDDPAELADRLRRWRSDIPGWRARFAPLSARLRERSWDDMAREIIQTAAAVPPAHQR